MRRNLSAYFAESQILGEVTHLTDAMQTALAYGFPGCVVAAAALFQGGRLIGALIDLVRLAGRYIIPIWRVWTAVKVAAISGVLWALSGPISSGLEWMEYAWIDPAYLPAVPMDDAAAVEAYEHALRKHCDEYEAGIVIERTRQIADTIHSTPRAIYEAALLECGLNPFRVRDDGVAAGWIQFTRAGLSGLGATMPEVIAACRRHDVRRIMDLTEAYLRRRWEHAGKPDMRNTIDLYLAVFAPAHIGAAPEQVVYAGFGNPAYDLNSGLDGWYQDGRRIMRSRAACDGKITVWEIFLCLEKKKTDI